MHYQLGGLKVNYSTVRITPQETFGRNPDSVNVRESTVFLNTLKSQETKGPLDLPVSCNLCLVPGTWYHVLGTKYLVPNI